jgi:hypothetical protein
LTLLRSSIPGKLLTGMYTTDKPDDHFCEDQWIGARYELIGAQREELSTDVALLEEEQPELLAAVQEVVCHEG